MRICIKNSYKFTTGYLSHVFCHQSGSLSWEVDMTSMNLFCCSTYRRFLKRTIKFAKHFGKIIMKMEKLRFLYRVIIFSCNSLICRKNQALCQVEEPLALRREVIYLSRRNNCGFNCRSQVWNENGAVTKFTTVNFPHIVLCDQSGSLSWENHFFYACANSMSVSVTKTSMNPFC